MPVARLRRSLRKCQRGLLGLWRWLERLPGRAARTAFSLVCWLTVATLSFGLIWQVTGLAEAKVVAALVAGLLAAAFLGAYGREIASRIKRVGPLELFEAKKKTRYLEAAELPKPKDLVPGPGGAIKTTKLSDRQRFYFDRLDRFLHYLEYSASEPTKGAQQDEHYELLFTCAHFALATGEWTKAIYWFKRLEKLSHRGFRSSLIDNYVAMSCLYSVLDKQDEGKARELFREAVERLGRLAREHTLDYLGYFWLAYVQDEIGEWYEAVKSNEETLKRRPRYAPAKYNASVSLAKLGQYRQAYAMLARIEPSDEFAPIVLNSAEADRDLWEAVKDRHWERKMLALVRHARSKLPAEGE